MICKMLRAGLTLLVVGFAPTAWSSYSCTGHVKDVAIEATSGDVFVDSLGALSWPRLCSVRAAVGNISPEACRAVYSTLLVAQMSGKQVELTSSSTAVSSCAAHPAWTYVDGFYFLRILTP
jgi:hypothetical protein